MGSSSRHTSLKLRLESEQWHSPAFAVIASAGKQSTLQACREMHCFGTLAMTHIRPVRPNRRSALERIVDGGLGVLLNPPQMSLIAKALSIDLVDVLGAGGSCGEPSMLSGHLDAAKRLAVAGGCRQRLQHRFAGQFPDPEFFRRERLQQGFLGRGGRRVDALI